MPLFVSATTPLPPALSLLPSHAPCLLKLCPYSLATDWTYFAYLLLLLCTSLDLAQLDRQVTTDEFCLNSSSVSVPSPCFCTYILSYKLFCVSLKTYTI